MEQQGTVKEHQKEDRQRLEKGLRKIDIQRRRESRRGRDKTVDRKREIQRVRVMFVQRERVREREYREGERVGVESENDTT